MEFAAIIIIALMFDLLIGDPNVSWHPVALIGKSALRLEKYSRACLGNGYLAGTFCALTIILISALIGGGLVLTGLIAGQWCKIIVSGFVVYITIAPRSLISHTMKVATALMCKDMPAARHAIGMITSRDPEALDEAGIVRSAIETLGENVIDGVTSALFYAMVGYMIAGAPGAACFAMGYRAANTLDASFGYKNERYIRFGTFAARFDDVLNFIPARLTLFAVFFSSIILNLRPVDAVKYAWRDRKKHPSPNSTWGMVSFAGALGVQLGGPTQYRDKIKEYPYWGEPKETLSLKHIIQAQRLVAMVTIVFALMCVVLAAII